ncbi:MAG TPA: formate dehydrogenase subunit beta [Myxococcales bacterium]|nr:formate dehydrogenase subunit beta [Myxococcales bacterium]
MGALQGFEIRRSSASLRGGGSTLRKMPVVAKYIDTSICIGCKACEVACQEWNDLPIAPTEQVGTYQTMPTMRANYWNLIKFNEVTTEQTGLEWLLRKDQCMHCDDPGCLAACPAPGAIVQYQNGIVDVDPERCIGCKLCETGCPFDVPRYAAGNDKMAKCTLCVDRVQVGLEPACIKACPTGCLQFGDKASLVQMAQHRITQLKEGGFANAMLYDPPGVGGTGVITVLKHGDHPEWYGLPKDPSVPTTVSLWKRVIHPIGFVAMAAAVFGAIGHFMAFGPKKPKDTTRETGGEV